MSTVVSRILRWLLIIVGVAVVLCVLYTWGTLHWSYSSGDRAGYVQKFSHKGWMFKTWEGELSMVSMPGTTPEKFYFSVRDDSVAAAINKMLGGRVALHYEQHIGVPVNWFGESEYFVVSVRLAE
jgi:hypothetical protein